MGSHYPFGYLKHKLWPKEGPRVKLPIWLPTTKSRESPNLLFSSGMSHTVEKFPTRVITLLSTSSQSKVYTRSYEPAKLREFQFREFRDSQLGSPETKWHLGASPVDRHKEYYKGEDGGFPQVWVVMNLVSLCLPMAHPCTKSATTTH
jgi:hypothetical protein